MKIAVDSFRGMVPKLTPRALQPNAAQLATNARLQTGDLEAWRQFALTKALANTGPVQTIYLLNERWLSWDEQVDVARGLIPGDTTYRTYLTCPALYPNPRYTNYALSGGGPEPYPVETRPIGVPTPDSAPVADLGPLPTPEEDTFSIDVIVGNGELESSWMTSAYVPLTDDGVTSQTGDDETGGEFGGECYQLHWQGTQEGAVPCYIARNFGVGSVVALEYRCTFMCNEVSGRSRAGFAMMRDLTGKGLAIRVDQQSGGWKLAIGTATTWADAGSMTKSVPVPGMVAGDWYGMLIKVTMNEAGTQTVTASVTLSSDFDTVLGTITGTLNTDTGDYCGYYATFEQLGAVSVANFDGHRVTASGVTRELIITTATSYVVTFNNDLDEEGPPSPASATLLRPDGVSVDVTMPTTAPAGYGVATKNLYRAVTGASGTVFVLVAADLPLAQTTYTDTLDDSEIASNDILESDEWDLPPDDMQGIIALPNGIMAGFSKNRLCLSVQGRPHAWPVRYRRITDTDIVAIANIDNTIVIGTKSFVYTATGNSPDTYSMSKPGEPQACTSKRGMVYLTDVGVVFPSPDGFMLCAGSAGQVSNLTGNFFTKKQWQALDPDTVLAAVHDGVLFFWVGDDTDGAGYALDVSTNGFGLIGLSHHASAAHVDPLTDAMYLVLDSNDEPTDVMLPEATSAPVVTEATTIYQFDADESELMVYRWRGKLNLTPYPATFEIAQVRCLSYSNVVFRILGNGALIHERLLTNIREFVLPAFDTYDSIELELIGTATVRTAQVAEDVLELT